MSRIGRSEMFALMLGVLSGRSTCNRANVGAIIAKDSRIISTGYNGPPSGWSHCTPQTCNKDNKCNRSIHAEANVIIYAAKNGISIEGSTLWCTMSPCYECCKLIANSGIKRVIYLQPYRKSEHLIEFRSSFECFTHEEAVLRDI